jgi:hypothetical protein
MPHSLLQGLRKWIRENWGCDKIPLFKRLDMTLHQRDTGGRTNQPVRRNRPPPPPHTHTPWSQVDILTVKLQHDQQSLVRLWGTVIYRERCYTPDSRSRTSEEFVTLSRRGHECLHKVRLNHTLTPNDLLNDLGEGFAVLNKDFLYNVQLNVEFCSSSTELIHKFICLFHLFSQE